MIKTGIDRIAFYTPRYALKLATLANARGIDPDKFEIGLGQQVMSVPPPGEDIITMAANAGLKVLDGENTDQIEMVLFATESGIDHSKSAGVYVHELLNLPSRCRVLELKQACYSATGALQLVMPFLRENPDKKVLLIASDIARYGLGTTGESSQGACAVAMLLSANPRIVAIEPEFGAMTENVMDFWRPHYLPEALVDGKYSSKLYLTMLDKTFKQYQSISGRGYDAHHYFCYHTPVPRLVEKAHQHLLKITGTSNDDSRVAQAGSSLHYSRQIGNSYTASLYLSLACLLDSLAEDSENRRIGFYSYGSGCVAEYFSGLIQPGFKDYLFTTYHQEQLERQILSYEEYVEFYNYPYNEKGEEQFIPQQAGGVFRLAKLKDHKRFYEIAKLSQVEEIPAIASITRVDVPDVPKDIDKPTKIAVPAKIILSGEHAVVYGSPAIAMAVNRYTTATITANKANDIEFDFANIAYQHRVSVATLRLLKERIKEKYQRFIRGEYSIRQVLKKPFELAQFALSLLADSREIQFPTGMTVKIESQIPMGCGMGSSAATILAVLHAISNYLELPFSEDALLKIAIEAEHMQHGFSSGLDLRIVQSGGCLYMHNDQIIQRPIPKHSLYLINTGTPDSTTGECVAHAKQFLQDPQMLQAFSTVTRQMDDALRDEDKKQFRLAIRANQQLLNQIEVVPQNVQRLITEIERCDGAAKICGAGAVFGDKAGVVLVDCDDEAAIIQLCRNHQYEFESVYGDLRGVHAA